VRQSWGHPQLALVGLGQMLAHPAPVGGRVAPDVDRDVKHLAAHHAHQFALRPVQLEMHAAQHVARRAGVVVLHEIDVQTGGLGKHPCIKAL